MGSCVPLAIAYFPALLATHILASLSDAISLFVQGALRIYAGGCRTQQRSAQSWYFRACLLQCLVCALARLPYVRLLWSASSAVL